MLSQRHLRAVFLFAAIIQLVFCSVYIFSEGFLLKRDVLGEKSTPLDFKTNCPQVSADGAWLPKTFEKVFIVIIDALRYDFATYNKSRSNHFENKLSTFHNLLMDHPEDSLLLKFVADPPTTTMQRLKGITTGSLPTFIDAGHNFASEEILEDNLIDQLKSMGRRIVMLGDDTWDNLFPKRFHRSHFFPSFNVMDLDTVDDGILQQLPDILEKQDFDVLILHFLGVDHCGHRYGPFHSEMARKLKQMDNVIRLLADKTDNSSLLLVMGDHGMTSTGDHGGDSQEELEAALFFYSPGLEVKPGPNSRISIPQVDIVPTLSLLLGSPIPFSNLGTVIEDVFLRTQANFSCNLLSEALYFNYKQVARYLNTYNEAKEKFPSENWKELRRIANEIDGPEQVVDKEKLILQYLTLSRVMCEDIWAKFDVITMLIGLFLLFCFIILLILFVCDDCTTFQVAFGKIFVVVWVVVNGIFAIAAVFKIPVVNTITVLVPFILFFVIRSSISIKHWLHPSEVIYYGSPFICLCLGSFSNSVVIVENYVCPFLVLTLLGLLALKYFLNRSSKSISLKRFSAFRMEYSSCIFLVSLCCLSLCLRTSPLFWKCREEQFWCDNTRLVHQSIGALPKSSRNRRFFTSLTCIICLNLLYRYWMKSCGNLNCSDLSTLVAKYCPILSASCLVAYWALKSAEITLQANVQTMNAVLVVAQLVYLITVLASASIWHNPIFVYILPKTESIRQSELIPQLFTKLRNQIDSALKGDDGRGGSPTVYGLATCLSAPFLAFLSLLYFVITLIAGDGLTSSIFLLFLSMVFCLIFHSCWMWRESKSVDDFLNPSFGAVCVWFLLSQHFFYALGQQPTFSAINWHAAFVGYAGDSGGNLIPTLLIAFNTFSSYFLFGLSLPLLVLFPLGLGFVCPSIKNSAVKISGLERGEYILVERPSQAVNVFVRLSSLYVALHAIKVFFVAFAAFILRRHLMVWKIFAPHFIFESLALGVTMVSVTIGMLFVFRVLRAVEWWTKKIS